MKLRYRITLSLLIIGILGIALGIHFITVPFNKEQRTMIFDRGISTNTIIQKLVDEKVINNRNLAKALIYYFSLSGKSLKSGKYSFSPGDSMYSIIQKMIRGEVVVNFITIVEGMTNYEIIDLIQKNPELKGEITKVYPEGSFLPETYDYLYGEMKQNFIDRLFNAQKKYIESIWNEVEHHKLATNDLQELIILASIIEKETSLDSEREVVSSVFHNRLKIGMKLQADPTIIYGITKGEYKLDRKLNVADLKSPSEYNTYINNSLPPTPICNPGKKSIYAALFPADTNYYYFVSDNNGGHNFSNNLREHNKNVRYFKKMQKNK